MIKVSIIVPVYNNELYIRECLNSILKQTLTDIEILVVNDGSTDRTPQIVQEYVDKDSRVQLFNIENAGYGYAVNYGICQARGKYIGIVESDDYIASEMYEELYDIAEREGLDIIKGDFNKFVGEEYTRSFEYVPICDDDLYGRVITPIKELDAYRAKLYVWAGIYRTEFLKRYEIRVNESPGASYQDNGFWFLTFYYAQKVYFVNKVYYYLRRDNPNSSIMSKDKVECIFHEYEFIEECIQRDKTRFRIIEPVFWYYRYKTYMAHLNRIAPEHYYTYVDQFRDVFYRGFSVEKCEHLFSNFELQNIRLLLESTKLFVIENMYTYLDFLRLFNKYEEVWIFIDENWGIQILNLLLNGRIGKKKIRVILGENIMQRDIMELYPEIDYIDLADLVFLEQVPVIICSGRTTTMDNYDIIKRKGGKNVFIFSHRWIDKESILFSVIVPIYNAQETLEQCLDSIVGQTYGNLEIILVEDGCTDRSDEICRRYAANDKRVKIIRQSNCGVVRARKSGLSAASGQYIGYVDADDWIEPHMYEAVYNELQRTPVDILVTGCIKEYSAGSKFLNNRISTGTYQGDRLKQEIHAKMLYYGAMYQYGIQQYIWNKIYKREILYLCQMEVDDSIVNGEDVACVYPALLNAKAVKVINKHFYHYRISEGTMTSQFYLDFPERAWKLYKYLYTCFEKDDMKENLLWQLDYYYLHYMRVGANKALGIQLKGKNTAWIGRIPYGTNVFIIGDKALAYDVYAQVGKCPYCMVVAPPMIIDSEEGMIDKFLNNYIKDSYIVIATKKDADMELRRLLCDRGIEDQYIISAF